jgi:hypothetical protein
MMLIELILIAALSALQGLPSAEATIAGRVLDATTRSPIRAARVRLLVTDMELRTDSAGVFSFGDADVDMDTLTVDRDGYHQARVVLDGSMSAVSLDIGLRPLTAPGLLVAESDALAEAAGQMAALSGGLLWTLSDFWPALSMSSHPLQLLYSTGVVERVTLGRLDGPCVELTGGSRCADVWVDGDSGSGVDLRDHFPTEVVAFVVVAPDRRVPTLGMPNGSPGGIVVVFLKEGAR